MHDCKNCFPELLPDAMASGKDLAHALSTQVAVPPLKPIYRLMSLISPDQS